MFDSTEVTCPDQAPPPSYYKETALIDSKSPVGLMSKGERYRLMERAFYGLYRWYTERSQKQRNWSADTSFQWRDVGKKHSESFSRIVEGFYAVEQYIPDYVAAGLEIFRDSFGRTQFHLRWGAEEERHSDLWRNSMLATEARDVDWVEDYGHRLRGKQWHLPWDDPLHMVFYTVIQERATQVSYVNLGLVAQGEARLEEGIDDADPVMAAACRQIAVDEAAHYHFFAESARLFLYYFPVESVEALVDVIRHFGMPAREIIPDYDKFGELLHKTAVFGVRQHSRDVVAVALKQLGVKGLKHLEKGIAKSRLVPEGENHDKMRLATIFESLDYEMVEKRVKQLFERSAQHVRAAGLDMDVVPFRESGFRFDPAPTGA